MLEVRSLYKTYHPKRGAVTKALDGVTLTFPETGMVFILGKSGSGKSTLLNVCGGLDRADSGEIIIKGKSSSEFSGSDFDSYRNTYVGFIFQEYNILNELTIGENIALALELQNKKCDKERVESILQKVEMENFAGRKPNTLSGGQKQRIAIARALVKEPQIIMADEPTGALDSVTGKLVFDILKKLSKEKLVLIVSHDREFAEQYADRIIELKDGKVISDQVKNESENIEQKNVNFYGNDTVCVKRGGELTEEEFSEIKQFILKSKGSTVITTAKDTILQIKEKNPEVEARGAFDELKEQPKSKQYEKQQLIRSHMPLKHAVKMGASSLKIKPIRLGFTILLSVIAFILFGLSSTLMLFNAKTVKVQTMVDLKPEYLSINKSYQVTSRYRYTDVFSGEEKYEDFISFYGTPFTDREFEEYEKANKGAIKALTISSEFEYLNLSDTASEFYSKSIYYALSADNSSSFNLLAGRMPSALDEIIITDYIYDAFKSKGTTYKLGENKVLSVNGYDSIIYSDSNKFTVKLVGDDTKYKIVGVFKGMSVAKTDMKLKECADNGEWDFNRIFSPFNYYAYGIFSAIGVSKELFNELKNITDYGQVDSGNFYYSDTRIAFGIEGGGFVLYPARMSTYKENALPLYGIDGKLIENPTLKDNEFALPAGDAIRFYSEQYKNLDENDPRTQKIKEIVNGLVEAATEKFKSEYPEPADNDDAWGKWNTKLEETALNANPFTRSFFIANRLDNKTLCATIKECADIFNSANYTFKIVVKKIDFIDGDSMDKELAEGEEVKLVGYYLGNSSGSCYLSDKLHEKYYTKPSFGESERIIKYKIPEDAYISHIFVPYDGSKGGIEKWLNIKLAEDESLVSVGSSVLNVIDMIAEVAQILQTVFLVAGLVLAVFSFLLIFNFISLSIATKKKDIGILRAIGARAFDVFKIFFSESLIITTICFAIAVVGSISLCALFNSIIFNNMGIAISLFVFGPLSVFIVLGISIFAAFISTILPVLIYTRKPPVESIRAL